MRCLGVSALLGRSDDPGEGEAPDANGRTATVGMRPLEEIGQRICQRGFPGPIGTDDQDEQARWRQDPMEHPAADRWRMLLRIERASRTVAVNCSRRTREASFCSG